jgi:hypothetical protein
VLGRSLRISGVRRPRTPGIAVAAITRRASAASSAKASMRRCLTCCGGTRRRTRAVVLDKRHRDARSARLTRLVRSFFQTCEDATMSSERAAWTRFVEERERERAKAKAKRPRTRKSPEPSPEELEQALCRRGRASAPVFYTFRKSSLLPKSRDVTYRQRKSLCILARCTSDRFVTPRFFAALSTVSTLGIRRDLHSPTPFVLQPLRSRRMLCALLLRSDATFVRPAIPAHRKQDFILVADGEPTFGPLGDIIRARIELVAA